MRSTTFSRLMLVFILVIALCVGMLLGIFYLTMRDMQIQNRMDALKMQAYDIAYLSGTIEISSFETALGLGHDASREMLRQKLRSVYEDYSAYCLVVDRSGQGTAYFLSMLDEDKELRAAFDPQHIVNRLKDVLNGQELVDQINTVNGPMFTVAVPWNRGGIVLGAVYIQTAAQTVRASYEGLIIRVALAAFVTVLLGALLISLYTRRFTKPLKEIARTSTNMASGDFSHRVFEGSTKEIYDMAVAFNIMADKLSDTEQKRRDFIANLSHELRSPMTNIRGFIQGILDGTIKESDEKHYLTIVLNETNRLSKLITSLLNLSRIEDAEIKLEKIRFDINELIRLVVITKIKQIEDNKIEMKFDFAQEESRVYANRDQIEQVLINLVDNAIKFSPQGGVIQIKTENIDNHSISVTIKDNGVGVLKQDAPFIFNRFYKADKAHTAGNGTGLGLAISKTILSKHNQRIELLDGNDGASFRFTLERYVQTELISEDTKS